MKRVRNHPNSLLFWNSLHKWFQMIYNDKNRKLLEKTMKRNLYKKTNVNKTAVFIGIILLVITMFIIRYVGMEYWGILGTEDKVQNEKETLEDVLIETEESTEVIDNHPYDFTVCFAGDINLDDNWGTTVFMDSQENGIYDCISEELIKSMQEADIMCLNNEFTFTERGEKIPGKLYHFRANPSRVEVLKELGVDVVKLANNHACDYGSQSLLDTMDTLKEAEIEYIGAGKDLEEAMTPVYMEVDGKTVAFVAATRAEKNIKTPQATETEPGVLRCYETDLFVEAIKEAKKNADFVLAYVHWGTEYSYELEEVQLTSGKEYLDAGADAIIGAHSHCLQGMEYYEGKPIIYSLGNYWFNEKTLDTMLLELHFSGNDLESQLDVKVIPAIQEDYKTTFVSDKEERERIFSFLEGISINVSIDENGILKEIIEVAE